MSADNGIYIGEFSDGFRVIHAQAIDNIAFDPDCGEFNSEAVVRYYSGIRRFETNKYDAAYKQARQIENEILDSDMCPILEYGICHINFPQPLSHYENTVIEKCKETLRLSGFVWGERETCVVVQNDKYSYTFMRSLLTTAKFWLKILMWLREQK